VLLVQASETPGGRSHVEQSFVNHFVVDHFLHVDDLRSSCSRLHVIDLPCH
jgi:hypothetical protein